MSIALIACARHGPAPVAAAEVHALAARLRPDNLDPHPGEPLAWSHTDHGVTAAVLFPGRMVRAAGLSVALGPVPAGDDQRTPLTSAVVPAGAAGLLRADSACVEVATDMVASRTLWFVCTDTVFVASTSQRALHAVLGSFEPDESHLPWVLATGKLSPRRGWDRRVCHLRGASTLRLDRARWTVTVHERDVPWQAPSAFTVDQHLDRLDAALEATFAAIPRASDLVLPISGGYDSRGLLIYLQRTRRPGDTLRTLTWGRREAMNDPASDAAVARDLCRTLGVENTFHELRPTEVPFQQVFGRFVAQGEGRIDHLSGYLDGFGLWASLHAQGVRGILRGDMAFGYPPARSPQDVRFETGIPLVGDLRNLRSIPSLARHDAVWPDAMRRLPGESPTAWNNRLGHTYRLPTALAALTHLKTGYVEVLNPLLSDRVIDCARALPLSLFVLKSAWKTLVRTRGPAVRFAVRTATTPTGDVLARPDAATFLHGRLEGEVPDGRLPADVVAFVRAAVAPRRPPPPPTLAARAVRVLGSLRPWIPVGARGPLRALVYGMANPRQVALRAALLGASHDLLIADARLFPRSLPE